MNKEINCTEHSKVVKKTESSPMSSLPSAKEAGEALARAMRQVPQKYWDLVDIELKRRKIK